LEGLYLRLGHSVPHRHCQCWLPAREEVKQMIAAVREAECCPCPCDDCNDGSCTCCDCC
jgi:hypothetical protein